MATIRLLSQGFTGHPSVQSVKYFIRSLQILLIQVSTAVMRTWSAPRHTIVTRVLWSILTKTSSIVTAIIWLWVVVDLAGVTILRVVHGVVVVIDWRLLLDHLGPGAAAGHGATEEDVDQQHDAEEDTEGNAEVGEPGWVEITGKTSSCSNSSCWTWLCYEHRGGGCDGVIFAGGEGINLVKLLTTIAALIVQVTGWLGTGSLAHLNIALEVGSVGVGHPEHGVEGGGGGASLVIVGELWQQLGSSAASVIHQLQRVLKTVERDASLDEDTVARIMVQHLEVQCVLTPLQHCSLLHSVVICHLELREADCVKTVLEPSFAALYLIQSVHQQLYLVVESHPHSYAPLLRVLKII